MKIKLIEKVIRKVKNYEKYHITIHDEKWKNKMIKMALEIMNREKDKQIIGIIDKELSILNPCATTRISTLNTLKEKFTSPKKGEER